MPVQTNPRNYFAVHRNIFKTLGISLSQNESKPYRIYSTIFLLCITFTYPWVQFLDVFKFYYDIDILSISFTYSSLVGMGLAKAVILYYNRKSIGRTLDMLEEGVFAPNVELGGPEEAVLITDCMRSVNRKGFLYIGSVYLAVALGIADSIVKRLNSNDYHDWIFPLGTFSLFDVTYSPNFEIAYLYQMVCVLTIFMTLMLADVLITSILANIATQCVILQNRIRRMVDNAHKRMIKDMPEGAKACTEVLLDPSEIPWKYLQAILRETVVNHMKIIELAEKFEDQFSYLTLLQFLSTSCTLCFTIYYCSLFALTDFKFIQYMMGAGDIAIQVFLYCYWGNEVVLESQAISQACSETDYVGTDVRFQKGLLLMMTRSQRPIRITAGKFTTLSLNTFVWIIRASYSYFMVINSRT